MKKIELRPVKPEDKADLLAWANDPETVRSRFNSRPVTAQEHDAWFARALNLPERLLYIAEDGAGQKLGTVRLDRLSEAVLEYDINVAPAARGKGYGTAMIRAAAELYRPEARAVLFLARIKKTNPRSRAAFLRAGCQPLFTYCDREQGEIEVLGRIRP